MKKKIMLAAVAAACLAVSACGGAGTADSAGNSKIKAYDYLHASYDELVEGKDLKLAIGEVTPQQNLWHADSSSDTRTIWNWYNPTIVQFQDDGSWKKNDNYLEDIKEEQVNGKLQVTFTIKPEAKWNDGTEIDWTAFEATWKANNGENQKYKANSTDGFDQIEKVTQGKNAKQAVLHFKGQWPWWPAQWQNIMYPKMAELDVYNDGLVKKVHPEWGSGPYTIKTFDPDRQIVIFEPNPKWWGKPGKLTKITYTQMESQASLNAFQNGEIDATGVAAPDRLKTAQKMAKNGKNIKIYKGTGTSNSLLMVNAGNEIMKDIKVREALFKAVDRDTYAKIQFNGLNYKEEKPGSFILFPYQPGYENNFGAVVKYDQEAAKKLLDEAGWKPGADGIREKNGKKLSFIYPTFGDSPLIKALDSAMAKMYKDVGVEIKIDQRTSKQFSQTFANKDFDFMALRFSSSDPYGVAYFGQVYGSDSQLNISGTGTKALDQKIKKMAKLPTREEQTKRGNELEKEAFRLYGIMPLTNGPVMVAMNDKLANFGVTSFTNIPTEEIGFVK